MAITYVGGTNGPWTPAEGDWVFFFVYYANIMTWTLDPTTGWTLLRRTVDTRGTIELWARKWHTGDPTSWAELRTNYGAWYPTSDRPARDSNTVAVFRGLADPPTIRSATATSATFPILIPGITNTGIRTGDVALVWAASDFGSPAVEGSSPFEGSGGVSSGSSPGIFFGWKTLTTPGSSPSFNLIGSYSTPVPWQVMGLQLILPATPVEGGGGEGDEEDIITPGLLRQRQQGSLRQRQHIY